MTADNFHETEDVIIRGKTVKIDTLIVPLIKWLNSFPDIETLYSCQGTDGKKGCEAYVLFYWDQNSEVAVDNSLAIILQSLLEMRDQYTSFRWGECAVSWFENRYRYRLFFESEWHLQQYMRANRRVLEPYGLQTLQSICPQTSDNKTQGFTRPDWFGGCDQG